MQLGNIEIGIKEDITSCCRDRLSKAIKIRQLFTSIKGFVTDRFNPISNGDGGQTTAILERHIANARHAVANGDGGQTTAIVKRRTANARHIVGNSDGTQTCALRERRTANARHTIGNLDRGQTIATIERPISNARHTVGDDTIFTSNYQSVTRSFNNGITIIARIILCVPIFNTDGG